MKSLLNSFMYHRRVNNPSIISNSRHRGVAVPKASASPTPAASNPSNRMNRRRRKVGGGVGGGGRHFNGGATFVILVLLSGALLLLFVGNNHTKSNSISTKKKRMRMTKAAKAALPTVKQSYKLIGKTKLSHDSFLLKYELPSPNFILGLDPSLPTCIKVDYAPPKSLLSEGDEALLSKPYSPVSHPSTRGTFELIVKGYDYRPGGGVGKYLGDMPIGDSIAAALAPQRMMHGSPDVLGRGWKNVGLVGGGTGIAPLLQVARILLEDGDGDAIVRLLLANHAEEDILGRALIDRMAIDHGDRFVARYALTRQEPDPGRDAEGDFVYGRGDVAMARAALPAPGGGGDTMILVCGRDGFVEHWAGPVAHGPEGPDGSKGPKIQGPLLGVLKEAGYAADQVFKY